MKILIVDDKKDNLYLLSALLKGSGYNVVSAVNGAEALGLARKENPDLIITDILMPVMDGYTLCRECKKDEFLKHIPIIFYTATYTHNKDREFALSLGADAFILKPEDPDVFVAKIQEILSVTSVKREENKTVQNEETVVLKEYNEVLIRKLEDKMLQTAENEKKLKEYITRLEKTVEEWKKAEAMVGSIWQSTFDAMRLVDKDGIIVRVNEPFCRLAEMTEAELIGKPASVYHDPSYAKRSIEVIKKIIEEDLIEPLTERKIILHTGKVIWVEMSNCFLYQNNQKYLLSVFRDITERKKNIQELIEARERAEQMNKLKSSFLANMSHELRTPLIGILGYSEILKDDFSDAQIRSIGTIIHQSGTRLLQTLNSILNLSRIESGKFELSFKRVNLESVADCCIELFLKAAEEKDLRIYKEVIGKLPEITSDQFVLEQIFNNLISNAIKYTDKGEIKIILDGSRSDEDKVAIRVSDTGIGIEKEHQDLIWQEFRQVSEGFSRHYEGSGLGLTITKKFVEILCGTISVESTPGEGSVFTVELPVNCQKRQQKKSSDILTSSES